MKETYIKNIREACIAVNPEIMELSETSRVNIWWIDTPKDRPEDPDEENVLVFEDRNGWRDNGEWEGRYRCCIEDNVTGYYEILGRPIRLADVLLAIGKDESDVAWKSDVTIPRWKIIHSDITGSASGWNLRKDSLEEQSEETLSFLSSLITRIQ